MAKTESPAAEAAEQLTADATPGVAVELSLDEFCARLSETVKSPELIGAFHYSQRAALKPRDTAEAYQARFDKFVKTPV